MTSLIDEDLTKAQLRSEATLPVWQKQCPIVWPKVQQALCRYFETTPTEWLDVLAVEFSADKATCQAKLGEVVEVIKQVNVKTPLVADVAQIQLPSLQEKAFAQQVQTILSAVTSGQTLIIFSHVESPYWPVLLAKTCRELGLPAGVMSVLQGKS